MRTLLENARILDPERKAPSHGALLVEDGHIGAVFAAGSPGPEDVERADLGGRFLAPGFIDLHFHGALVLDPDAAPRASLERSSELLARGGTTAFLPTTVAWSRAELGRRVAELARASESGPWPGAEPIGIHLEGPWLRAEAAGAQPPGAIRGYDRAEGPRVIEAGAGRVRMVTLAPEIEGAAALLGELRRHDIVAALGHSLADALAIDAAVGEGLRHVTHLFNAMGSMHHRSPGTAGHALADDQLTCDLICDGCHVDPSFVRLASRAKGQGLLLISDRVELPDASVPSPSFGSGALASDGVAIRLPDGRLAASCLSLDRAVRNLSEFAGVDLVEAIAACTLRPARLLGIERERGTLRVGARADLVELGEDGAVHETWILGRPGRTAHRGAIP
jgi:N-acetylglucosamine-6-phosphate deacetylase